MDESAVFDQGDCETMTDSGEIENTGQPQQKIRDRIREKLIGPLEDSGDIR